MAIPWPAARSNRAEFASDRNTMVVVLTWAAGGVDALSYLGLGHVFTANMTGNAVLLGLSIGQGQGMAALRSMIALAGFVIGIAAAAIIMERSSQQGEWPRAVTWAIAVEWVILIVFTAGWHMALPKGGPLYFLILLSAVAMGIQSAAMRQLKVPGIATTYITGTLTAMVADFVGWLHVSRASPLEVDPTGQTAMLAVPGGRKFRGARLQAVVIVVYVAAALVSAFLQSRHSVLVTWSPLVAVGLVVISAVARHRRERLWRR